MQWWTIKTNFLHEQQLRSANFCHLTEDCTYSTGLDEIIHILLSSNAYAMLGRGRCRHTIRYEINNLWICSYNTSKHITCIHGYIITS